LPICAHGRGWTGGGEVRDVLADRLAALEVEPPRIDTAGCSFAAPIKSAAALPRRFVPGWPSDFFRKLRGSAALDDLRREIAGS
jgi:hypothetical protein